MRLEEYTLTWSLWFFALAGVILLYFILQLINTTLGRVNLLGKIQRRITEGLEIVLRLYEPLAILFLLVGFIFINPFLHGLLVAFIFILSYYPVKNYMNGRLFLLAHQLQEGQRITVNETSGVIRKLGRLGVSLQTKDGIRFINYTTLLADGYMLLRGEKIGRLHRLLIEPGPNGEALDIPKLNDKLFSCPYIDWSLRPEISKDATTDSKGYVAQLLVREDQHLEFLIELIREWGYGCRPVESETRF